MKKFVIIAVPVSLASLIIGVIAVKARLLSHTARKHLSILFNSSPL